MTTEADNYNGWISTQRQISELVRNGLMSKEKANEVLSSARKSYSEKNMLRAGDMLKQRMKNVG